MRRRPEPDTMIEPSLRQPVSSAWSGPRAMRRLVGRAALAITLLMPLAAAGQDVTAPALKAAFIYNFVRFTEWPAPPPASEPFVLCVLGDDAVGDALARVVEGREVAGRRMTVSLVSASASKDSCRVLYLSSARTSDAARVVAGLRDSPILTISDDVGFTDAGGMAQLFFERGQLRFNIRVEAVKRARLQMSSRLLVLARK